IGSITQIAVEVLDNRSKHLYSYSWCDRYRCARRSSARSLPWRPGNVARILVIEDNQENLELMTYLLKVFGHTTMSADDGILGLETARREHPDLIVCDIHLP